MALPKRWEPYCPVGTKIEGTRFISFKVPLNKNLCNKLPEDKRVSPSQLIEMIKEQGQSLAIVIDLTNTNRYYNKKEIESHGIQYEKIYTEGHKVPRDGVVKQFYSAVDRILEETDGEDSLIGVHCTHGVNRTGYLICRYMVEKMSVDPDEAIAAFTKARGHPIERENYLKDLQMRKDGGPGLKEDSADEGRDFATYNQKSQMRNFEPHQTDQHNRDRTGSNGYNRRFHERDFQPYWTDYYSNEYYSNEDRFEEPRYWNDDYYSSEDFYLHQDNWNHRGRNSQLRPPYHGRQFSSGSHQHSRWQPYSLDRRNSSHRTRRDQSDQYADSYHHGDKSRGNRSGYKSYH